VIESFIYLHCDRLFRFLGEKGRAWLDQNDDLNFFSLILFLISLQQKLSPLPKGEGERNKLSPSVWIQRDKRGERRLKVLSSKMDPVEIKLI
jgi:hypothetical protein